MSEWISVKERLPAPGEMVIAIGPDWLRNFWRPNCFGEAVQFGIQQLVTKDGQRWADSGFTHWLPLSSLPAYPSMEDMEEVKHIEPPTTTGKEAE